MSFQATNLIGFSQIHFWGEALSGPVTQGDKQRVDLFDRYSSNLTGYLSDWKDVFACPLCLQIFDRKSLFTNSISLEHVIPKVLGGKLLTLTCRECNNRDGSRLEADLVRQINVESIFGSPSTEMLRGLVKVGDGEITADVSLSPGSLLVVGHPELSNPRQTEAVEEALKSGNDEFRFSVNFGYNIDDSRIAVLRMGYLLMFTYFGYGYILHQNLDRVRKQILHPRQEIIPTKSVFLLKQTPTTNYSVNLIRSPSDFRCFIAVVNLPLMGGRCFGVVLPGLDESGEKIYERWHCLGEKALNTTFSIRTIPFHPEFLFDQKCIGLPFRLWNDL